MSVPTALRRVIAPSVPSAAVKVPEITLIFWVIKVLTTGTGEAAADYLAAHDLVLATGLGLAGLAAGLVLQLSASRYLTWVYWLAVTMVAVFGTMAADAVHVVLGIPYPATSIGYALTLAVIFGVWWRAEGTLDIHSITAGRRELFYWAAVLATFALGTAVGDLSANTLGLGFRTSTILYGVLIAVPAIGYRLGMNPVLAFWSAYVLTRPLGASIADWLGKPADWTGLGFGDGPVTLVGAVAIAVGVGYLTVAARGRQRQVTARA